MLCIAVGCGGGGHKSSKGEVFLEPAASTGADPFTPAAAPAPTPAATKPVKTEPVSSPGEVRSSAGATPGLYGGTMNIASCDKTQMINFLTSNPDKARAWAAVEGIAVGQLPSYIRSLTPVLLRSDTRVTNHGFVNGVATPHQSVLQAGTAVLVDDYGVPRARCYCGNPLLPPIPVAETPVYSGPRWPAFQPTTVIVVQPAPQPITTIVIVNINTGQGIRRPVGSDGGGDTPVTIPTNPPPTVTQPTTTQPLPTTTTTEPQFGIEGHYTMKITVQAQGANAVPFIGMDVSLSDTRITVGLTGGGDHLDLVGDYNPSDNTFSAEASQQGAKIVLTGAFTDSNGVGASGDGRVTSTDSSFDIPFTWTAAKG